MDGAPGILFLGQTAIALFFQYELVYKCLKISVSCDCMYDAALHLPTCLGIECIMPCDSQEMITRMIEADQRFIRICWYVYVAVVAVSIALTAYLAFHAATYGPALAGLFLTGIAFPIVPKQLQRIGAMEVLRGLQKDCDCHEVDDPACKRVADNVDALVRLRGGI